VVEGLAHPSLVPRQVPVGGGSEVSATAHRGRDPEPDGLAARREKDYEGGDGEEARGAGTGPHRREFRWDASTSKQASEESASRPGGKRTSNRMVHQTGSDNIGPSFLLGRSVHGHRDGDTWAEA
jgi:hypothetical protein